jgi:hypothetical protein
MYRMKMVLSGRQRWVSIVLSLVVLVLAASFGSKREFGRKEMGPDGRRKFISLFLASLCTEGACLLEDFYRPLEPTLVGKANMLDVLYRPAAFPLSTPVQAKRQQLLYLFDHDQAWPSHNKVCSHLFPMFWNNADLTFDGSTTHPQYAYLQALDAIHIPFRDLYTISSFVDLKYILISRTAFYFWPSFCVQDVVWRTDVRACDEQLTISSNRKCGYGCRQLCADGDLVDV